MSTTLVENQFVSGACDYCSKPIQFGIESLGQKAECPHCGKYIQLGEKAQKVSMAVREATHIRIRVNAQARWRQIAFWAGWFLFLIGFFSIIGSVLTPVNPDHIVRRSIALILMLSANASGVALILEGRRFENYWICSSCMNRLSSHKALLCNHCQAEFR